MCFSNYISAKSKLVDLQYFRIAVEVTVLKIIRSFVVINENFLLFQSKGKLAKRIRNYERGNEKTRRAKRTGCFENKIIFCK